MAIDTSLFMCDIPAGTYTTGDIIPMPIKAGSASVRAGYGSAILKQIMTGTLIEVAGSTARFEVVVENSNLIDPIINGPAALYGVTGLDKQSTGVQDGHDMPLEIMSVWNVYAKCIYGAVTTVPVSMFAAIDVDYPSVASVSDPQSADGIPTSIEGDFAVNVDALGGSAAATWDVYNVDVFKPGYKYLLTKLSITPEGTTNAFVGFVAFANAASQRGLCRIVPVTSTPSAMQKCIEYAAMQEKGPQDVKFMLFASAAATDTVRFITDYVKKAA